MGHARDIMAKVPHTCPAIDAAISTIKSVYRMANSAKAHDEPEVLLDLLTSIEFEMRSLDYDLEKLRKQNDDLRAIAIDALYEADEAEKLFGGTDAAVSANEVVR